MAGGASVAKIVIVTRKTVLEELVERHGTRGQALFLAASRGESLADVEDAHDRYKRALAAVCAAVPAGVRSQVIERSFLPTFLFGTHDLVVTLGQDGLVVNVAKYLATQPIVAFNPDPQRIDGVLVPFPAEAAAATLAAAIAGNLLERAYTMARAALADGQVVDAVNDLFVGIRSHASARYRLEYRGHAEVQSSSGIIVSTGAGSTGWYRSVMTATAGVAEAHLGPRAAGDLRDSYRFDPEAEELRFSVREPFVSRTSGADIVCGTVVAGQTLEVISQMPQGGVIFSDGMEQDFVRFDAGMRAVIGLADRRLRLLWPA